MRKPNSGTRMWFAGVAIALGLCLVFGLVPVGQASSTKNQYPSPEAEVNHGDKSFQSKPEADHKNNFRILGSDEKSLIIELITPAAQVVESMSETGPCNLLKIEGYNSSTEPGWPQLPGIGRLIGIPERSAPTITILEREEIILPEKYILCPVGTPIIRRGFDGQPHFEGYKYSQDQEAYTDNGRVNEPIADIVSIGLIRSQRVAQAYFQPYQYNPVTGQLIYFPRIIVRVDFNTSSTISTSQNTGIEDPFFEPVLQDLILNYDQARAWQILPVRVQGQISEADDNFGYKLFIEQTGIYHITYADLLSAGVPASTLDSLDPHTIKINHQGFEVAILVNGEQDHSFDPSDTILFFGEELDSVFSKSNIYWLGWGGVYGLRMASSIGLPDGLGIVPPSFKTTKLVEENKRYVSLASSGSDTDHWVWEFLYASGAPAMKNYLTTINHLDKSAITATVRGLLRGYIATPYHHTKIYINGHLIDDATWAADAEYSFEVNIPHAYLLEGANTITVECPMDLGISMEYLYINRFEIDYFSTYTTDNDRIIFDQFTPGKWEYQVAGFTDNSLQVFDISDPINPAYITGLEIQDSGGSYTLGFQQTISTEKKYLALSTSQWLSPLDIVQDSPSDLHSIDNSADYLIISHSDFISEVLPLANYRSVQGMRSRVVDVQDIYDEFNGGIIDPAAIHDFLVYAYTYWNPPAPSYVVLVGDGNYDFKDYLGRGEPNFIPPYLAQVDPWIGETAADNRYVTVSGNDILPDMYLGRLPVKSADAASMLVNKIINYENYPPDPTWNQQLLFVADNADIAGNFAASSDDLINGYLPSPYMAQKHYYGITYTDAGAVRTELLNVINQGRILVNYIGHSAVQFWGDEHFLNLADVSLLTNAEHLPMIVPMTCMEGYYIHPSLPTQDNSSLGESIVAATANGAIASWSPTGFGVATGHDFLNKGFFTALFSDDVIQLGPATTQAKFNLFANTSLHNELLDTYILFGDPATRLNVAPAEVSISKSVDPSGPLDPGDTITYTLSFANTGPATAHHVVIQDELPAELLNPAFDSFGAAVSQRLGTSFTWDVVDLPAGRSGLITITAMIDPQFVGVISNEASIQTSAREMNTINNMSQPISTIVQQPTSTLLTDFSGQSQPGVILLEWETASEINVIGFNFYRAETENGTPVKINQDLIPALSPGASDGNAYTFLDDDVVDGTTYYYWIEITTDMNPYINGPIPVTSLRYIHLPVISH